MSEVITEDKNSRKLRKPPRVYESKDSLLVECYGVTSSMYDYNADPKERLRAGIGQVVQALLDIAHEGFGDDGRPMRTIKYSQGEEDYWTVAGKMARRRINVDEMMKIVPDLKALLDSYKE